MSGSLFIGEWLVDIKTRILLVFLLGFPWGFTLLYRFGVRLASSTVLKCTSRVRVVLFFSSVSVLIAFLILIGCFAWQFKSAVLQSCESNFYDRARLLSPGSPHRAARLPV